MYKDVLAAPLLRNNVVLSKLIFNVIWVSAFFIDFVYSNNQRYTSRFCVLDSFDCLWHYTIISSNNKYNDICRLSTTSTHSCEGCVSRSIKESDHTVISFNVVCTNVLCNTTSFSIGNMCATNVIQCRCFTVVNVTHDSNNWCTSFNLNTVITIRKYRFF